jgi:hypothetical protein
MWKAIDQIGLLLVNIFNALKFAAFDYDAKLKITKTPRQRFIIWTTVTLLTIVGIFTILMLFGTVTRSLLNR